MEVKNMKTTDVDNRKICDVLRDEVPFREFYSGVIADSLNGIAKACGVNLGEITDIEIRDSSFDVQELGQKNMVSFVISFTNPENRVTVSMGRTNLVVSNIKTKRMYSLSGIVDGMKFDTMIIYDREGLNRVSYEVRLEKNGLHYRMKKDTSSRKELAEIRKKELSGIKKKDLVKFSMTKDDTETGGLSKEGKYTLPYEFRSVIDEIGEFRQNPEGVHLRVKGKHESMKDTARCRHGGNR